MAARPSFRERERAQITRRLFCGWFPMPITTVREGDVTYRQITYVAPVGDAPAGKPAWLRSARFA